MGNYGESRHDGGLMAVIEGPEAAPARFADACSQENVYAKTGMLGRIGSKPKRASAVLCHAFTSMLSTPFS